MEYEELIKNNAGEMIEKLIIGVISQDPFEVRFDDLDDEGWSMISLHIYEEDKEMSLRLLPDDRYYFHFGYYDDEDEFHEIIHPLTDEERNSIPERLRKVMKKVLFDERGMRLPANFISGQ